MCRSFVDRVLVAVAAVLALIAILGVTVRHANDGGRSHHRGAASNTCLLIAWERPGRKPLRPKRHDQPLVRTSPALLNLGLRSFQHNLRRTLNIWQSCLELGQCILSDLQFQVMAGYQALITATGIDRLVGDTLPRDAELLPAKLDSQPALRDLTQGRRSASRPGKVVTNLGQDWINSFISSRMEVVSRVPPNRSYHHL